MKNSFQFTLLILAGTIIFQSALAQPAHRPKASLNHTAILVTDLKKSANFYSNIIGLDTIPEPFHDGKHVWYALGPGVSLHVIEGAKKKQVHPKNHHTCFSVASVDAFIDILKKNNIPWEDRDGAKMATTTRPDGVKQIWFMDPDGYWIEINDARE